MYKGEDIINVGDDHIGENYVFGAISPLANPNWHGPWDCAEFISWCTYQAYGIIFAVRPPDPRDGESYSGWWYEDAISGKRDIPVAQAIGTHGAILVRRPRVVQKKKKIGHVAISLGDGTTLEAKDSATGVAVVPNVAGRLWHIGVHLPGVDYGAGLAPGPAYAEPPGLLLMRDPYMHGPEVASVQRALAAAGIDPGGRDGYFGPLTETAVVAFQIKAGLVPDAVVGPETAAALGLSWPIAPTPEDGQVFTRGGGQPFDPAGAALKAARIRDIVEARPPHADPGLAAQDAPVTFRFEREGKRFYAVPSEGERFFLANQVSYTDDMARVGLAQIGNDLSKISDAGVYDPTDWDDAGRLGPWAWFLWPTIVAESSGYFGRLNSYDRAAFTFGAYQFAAHTPEDNLVLLFRKLLQLPAAKIYFSDLALRPNAKGTPTVHRVDAAGTPHDLEIARNVTRPNGKVEKQIPDFMSYLNADPTKVDDAELTAIARLLLWSMNDPTAQQTQIELAKATAERKIARARAKVPALAGETDWRIYLWVNDIVHQGRGTFAQMETALTGANPLGALAEIGASKYKSRCNTVSEHIKKVEQAQTLNGWTP